MKTPIYIGRFTPAGGGITGKNKAIYDALSVIIKLEQIDLTSLKHGNIRTLFRLIHAICKRNGTLIIGTAAKMRRILAKWLYIFNRSTMRNSVLMVMGGQFGNIVVADPAYQRWVKQYKMLYVETQGMKDALHSVGVENVSIFPNCRVRPSSDINVHPRGETLKCVCFSMIYPEKGIDTALEVARQIPSVLFDFWGPVREDYRNEFMSTVNSMLNCNYCGVFQVDGDNVYTMLNQYDLLLFPTRMKGEGVPGTLIEAKIAALPAIVSDIAHNAELVEDGVSGIVMEENDAGHLISAINAMNSDDKKLTYLKHGAQESGKSYYFDEYIKDLLAEIGARP